MKDIPLAGVPGDLLSEMRERVWLYTTSIFAVDNIQAATASGKPVLLRVDWGTGHGIGTTTADQERMLSHAFSFLFWQMGVPKFKPRGGSR